MAEKKKKAGKKPVTAERREVVAKQVLRGGGSKGAGNGNGEWRAGGGFSPSFAGWCSVEGEMSEWSMKKGERLGVFLRLYALVVSSLLRNERECSLPGMLILLELEGAGELSTLALARRLEERGVKNARMTILRAEAIKLIDSERRGDGKWWRMSAEGRAVLERALRKVWMGRLTGGAWCGKNGKSEI